MIRNRNQKGQTLIETIIAIFVLTTGLTTGLGLAIYAFGASSNIVEQITATGFAREGIEVVRSMRDSNWLAGTLSDSCEGGQRCYPTWLTQSYNIDGAAGSGNVRIVELQPSGSNRWSIKSAPSGDYHLYVQPSGVYSSLANTNPTTYFRKIFLIRQSESAPYTAASPLLLARVVVWWHGKNCAPILDYNNPSDTTCKIVTEEYLTNWKNY